MRVPSDPAAGHGGVGSGSEGPARASPRAAVIESTSGAVADWCRLVAVGAVVGDFDPEMMARYAARPPLMARAALGWAEREDLVVAGQIVDPVAVATLVELLSSDDRSALLAALRRWLLTSEPGGREDVLGHCRAAAGFLGAEAIADLVEQAGRSLLRERRYAGAVGMLRVAADSTDASNARALAERLLALAEAVDGTGDVVSYRSLLSQVADLGVACGEPTVVARAAVRYSIPTDWFAGDPQALALLRSAEELDLPDELRVMVSAVRGMAEMRVPRVADSELSGQYSWVTNPSVAQPLTEAALGAADVAWPDARWVALMAWRATHRAPEHLRRRSEVTAEMVDLAQRSGRAWEIVASAEFAAVDAIERGDRPAYDRYVASCRWVAEWDANPRLRWRALSSSAGAKFLDGDDEAGRRLAAEAIDALSAWSARSDLTAVWFLGQEVIRRDDVEELASYVDVDAGPIEVNPIGQAGFAYVLARCGQSDRAREFLVASIRSIDSESSVLLHGARLAAVVEVLEDREWASDLVDLLTPFAEHVAVDSHGWWVDGPVSAWLARLHLVLGDVGVARQFAEVATTLARSIHDTRTIGSLAGRFDGPDSHAAPSARTGQGALDEREMQVLRLMAAGRTNPQIAAELAYSVSTIRDATVSIYRKLGVRGRADAVARASVAGLLH